MRINHKVLSTPPYISTSWKTISSLQSQQTGDLCSLSIHLQDGTCIVVPNLDNTIIQAIFHAHARYLELENKTSTTLPKFQPPLEPSLPFSVKLFEMENVNAMLQHNEQQKDAPDLPLSFLIRLSNFPKN